MKWLLSLLPDSVVEKLVRNLIGGMVAKWVGMAGAAMVAHGITTTTNAGVWQTSTAECIMGLVMSLVSHLLTMERDGQKQADIASAQATPTGAPLVLPKPLAVQTNISGSDPARPSEAVK